MSTETEVIVLFEGYSRIDKDKNIMKANCTCTLIKSKGLNIIVDTLTPWHKDRLMEKLRDLKIDMGEVHFVICTHGHSDHIGNNNLFLQATHIVGQSVNKLDEYDLNAFENGPYVINEHVKVVATPGHTLDSVSVEVQASDGLYIVAGDLFEKYEDLKDDSIWLEAGSENPEKQKYHRSQALSKADFIIPGHGPMFSTHLT